MQGGCPMCGTMNDQEPQTQDTQEPREIRRQIENLQQRLDDLERDQTTPEEVQQQTPGMCPMCQNMMGGMSESPSQEELEHGIQQQVAQLENRISELEHGRR